MTATTTMVACCRLRSKNLPPSLPSHSVRSRWGREIPANPPPPPPLYATDGQTRGGGGRRPKQAIKSLRTAPSPSFPPPLLLRPPLRRRQEATSGATFWIRILNIPKDGARVRSILSDTKKKLTNLEQKSVLFLLWRKVSFIFFVRHTHKVVPTTR